MRKNLVAIHKRLRQPRKKGKGKGGGIVKKMVGKSSYYFAQGLKMGRKSVVEHTVKKLKNLNFFYLFPSKPCSPASKRLKGRPLPSGRSNKETK